MVSAAFVIPHGALASSSASSAGTSNASLTMAAPEGFEALEAERQALLDIYYGGEKVGVARAVIKPGSVKFEDPTELARLIPGIASSVELAEALSGDLPANVDRACSSASGSPCPGLSPARAAIVFDADRFRADVFVNPVLLAVQRSSDPTYLDKPDGNLSLVSLFGGALSGSTRSENAYRVQNQTLVSLGAVRLRSDAAVANKTGLGLDNLTLEADRKDTRYVGGLFWAPGTEFLGRRRIVGVGARTQLDTRVDREFLQSTPLNVVLQRLSRVDLLVDGRVMASKIYSAGNHLLDTSQLPDGSYEVGIKIAESGVETREERRFFTKGAILAPLGRPLFSASVGVIPSSSRSLGKDSATPFYETSAAFRLSPRVGFDGFVFGTDQKAFLGGGAVLFSRWARFRVSGMLSTATDYGAVFQASSHGHSPLAFSFDLRKVKSQDGGPLLPNSTSHDTFSEDSGLRIGDLGSYTQSVGIVGYRFGTANLRLTGLYRRDASRKATYSIGPSFEIPVVRTNRWNVLLQADGRKTDREFSSYVGVRLITNAGSTTFSGAAGVNHQGQSNDDGDQGRVVGDAQAAWFRQLGNHTQVATEAAVGRDLESTYARTGGYVRSPAVNLRADLLHQFGDEASTEYAAALEGGIVAGKGDISVGGRELSSTAIVVRVHGEDETQKFEVLVDESPRGTVKPAGNLVLFLHPYDTYSVRLRAAGSAMANLDTAPRKVTVYPGNVATLDWEAAPVVVVFGRAVGLRGQPMANSEITTSRGTSQTNEEGYFQVETAKNEAITLRDQSGNICSIAASKARPIDGYLARGEAQCR